MSISVTNASQFLRRGILKDAALVVPDRVVGALQSVTLTNQRLSQLSQKIDLYVKQRASNDDKRAREEAGRGKYEAAKRRAASHFMNIDGSVEGSGGEGSAMGEIAKHASGGLSDTILEFLIGGKLLKLIKGGGKLFIRSVFSGAGLGALVAGGMMYGDANGMGALNERLKKKADTYSLKDLQDAYKLQDHEGIIDTVKKSWHSTTDFMSKGAGQISTLVSKKWSEIQDGWSKGATYISETVKSSWKNFTETTSKYANNMEDWFTKQGSNMGKWFDSIIMQLNKYVNSFELKKLANDWLNSLSDWIKNKFGFGSKSSASSGGDGGGAAGNGSSPYGGLATPGSSDWSPGNGATKGFNTPSSPSSPTPPSLDGPQTPLNPRAPVAPWGASPPDSAKSTSAPTAKSSGPFGDLITPNSPSWSTNNVGQSAPAGVPAAPSVGTPTTTTNTSSGYGAQGYDIKQVAQRIQQVRPEFTTGQCVELAFKYAGIPYDGNTVKSITRGMPAVSKEGLLPIGTPVSTFFNKDWSIGNHYAAGGTGTPGIGRDHMGVIVGYTDKAGKPTTDPSKVAFVQLMNQWKGQSPTVTNYAYSQDHDHGEHNGNNYYSINDSRGHPAGLYNPLAYQYWKEHRDEKASDTTGGKSSSATPNVKTFGNVDLAFGDSTAHRLGLPGDAKDGRNPKDSEAALDEYLKSNSVRGKNVVISSVANDNSLGGYNHVINMAQKLKAAGANVNILGTGPGGANDYRPQDQKYNDLFSTFAAQNGMSFTPMGPTADSIHEKDAKAQLQALSQATVGGGKDSGDSVSNPAIPSFADTPMVMPKAIADGAVKPTETTEQAGTPYKTSSPEAAADSASGNAKKAANVYGDLGGAMDMIKSHSTDPHLLNKNVGDHL